MCVRARARACVCVCVCDWCVRNIHAFALPSEIVILNLFFIVFLGGGGGGGWRKEGRLVQHMDKDEEKTCPSSTNNPTNYTYTIYI